MGDLLNLALDEPDRAAVVARTILDDARSAEADQVLALQALGIALREAGDMDGALATLREGVRRAEALEDPDRLADMLATYGGTLAVSGQIDAGLRHLDRAVRTPSSAQTHGRVLMRRAFILSWKAGRHGDADEDWAAALRTAQATDDRRWEARVRENIANVDLLHGRVDAAEAQVRASYDLLTDLGEEFEAAIVLNVLGEIAFVRGNLPQALRTYDDVADRLERWGRPFHAVRFQHQAAYRAAGLAEEAASLVETVLESESLDPTLRPEFRQALGEALLELGKPDRARQAAAMAVEEFRNQRRPWFELRARLLLARCDVALGRQDGLGAEIDTIARSLHADRAAEAPGALILAGQVAGGAARVELWGEATSYRGDVNPLVGAHGWLATALLADAAGDRRGALRACGRGLDALAEYRQRMASSELRAFSTAHGRQLAQVALRNATARPRRLLEWSERWRATALAQTSARTDVEVSTTMAALRDNGRRLATARRGGEPTEGLERQQQLLERQVRAEDHRRSAAGVAVGRLDVGRLVLEVGPGAFVELVEVDGLLQAVVIVNGKVHRLVVGQSADAEALAERGRFALRRAARGGGFEPGSVGLRLQQAVLGDVVRLLPDGPVTIAPTARLHGAPWALMPALVDRPFGVVPSAAQWLRARDVPAPADGHTVLVAGPDLGTGGAEVPVLADRFPDASMLAGADATVPDVLAALEGARLAHVAAHGHFRAESPMFSALDLADGPLNVYELERLGRAPHRLVLSACDSGVVAPVGAEEVLGLAAGLLSVGCAGLVCSVGQVNDEASAELMVDLHDRLALGEDPATALHGVRRRAAGDPLLAATAAAYLALGV